MGKVRSVIWQRYPTFRIFIALTAGILLFHYIKPPPLVPYLLLGISSAFLGITGNLKYFFRNYTRRLWFGLAVISFFVALGMVLSQFRTEKEKPCHYSRMEELRGIFQLHIVEEPVEKENTFKAEVQLRSLEKNNSIYPLSGRALVYFQKDSAAATLTYGDKILFRGAFAAVDAPRNAHEFDYKSYLNRQAIYSQTYAPSGKWMEVEEKKRFSLPGWSAGIRNRLLTIVDDWPLADRERSVTKALLLGYRSDIRDSLLEAYSSAGVTHILAVSGLHIGIIYLMTYYILYFLERIKYGRWFRTAILVILLWVYALVTGMSPSVVRAATMFTFVAAGTGFKRKVSIYNTLLASALVLLLLKPAYLFEAGFQLSYLAVFGIVWLQPKFQSLWQPGWWLWRQVWAIITVSLAAQMATFPLALYYFHQFPSLFLLSNVMVIPLITILMYTGILALLLSALGWLIIPLISIYDFLLQLMNSGVKLVESWSVFLIDNIHIDYGEVILLYVLVLCSFSWLFYGKLWRLQISLGLLAVLTGIQLWENYDHHSAEEVTFYSVPGHTAVGYSAGKEFLLLTDSALLHNDQSLDFHIQPHIRASNATKILKLPLDSDYCSSPVCKKGKLISVSSYVFWIFDPASVHYPQSDCWLICGKKEPPAASPEHIPERIVVSLPSQSPYCEKWKTWAGNQGSRLVNVDRRFFRLKLL